MPSFLEVSAPLANGLFLASISFSFVVCYHLRLHGDVLVIVTNLLLLVFCDRTEPLAIFPQLSTRFLQY